MTSAAPGRHSFVCEVCRNTFTWSGLCDGPKGSKPPKRCAGCFGVNIEKLKNEIQRPREKILKDQEARYGKQDNNLLGL